MKKWLILMLGLCLESLMANPKTAYNPLSVYRGGVLFGSVYSLNPELRDYSEQFLKLNFDNRISVSPQVDVVADVNWHLPGNNFGFDLGADFYLFQGSFKPFMGFGVGAQYFDKYQDFGENIGALVTARLGMFMEIGDRLSVLIQVPYSITTNVDRDNSVGLQIGFVFSDGLRHVQKISWKDL